MTTRKFATKIKQMRDLQSQYFATRDTSIMRDCKKIEREVDDVIKEILNPQPSLLSMPGTIDSADLDWSTLP
jgi:hypothetical protein